MKVNEWSSRRSVQLGSETNDMLNNGVASLRGGDSHGLAVTCDPCGSRPRCDVVAFRNRNRIRFRTKT